jgi:hypothetical protein
MDIQYSCAGDKEGFYEQLFERRPALLGTTALPAKNRCLVIGSTMEQTLHNTLAWIIHEDSTQIRKDALKG